MLDITTERIVSFSEAAGLLPRRRRGRKPHVATLYRWSDRGCRGVVLETVQVGGTRCTSIEALQRFFDRLSQKPAPTPPPLAPSTARRLAAVDRELDAAGY